MGLDRKLDTAGLRRLHQHAPQAHRPHHETEVGAQRRLAGKPGKELGPVVGDQLSAVARAADHDVEVLLRREVEKPGLHRRDYVLDRAALEGMRGGGPAVLEMAQLWVALAQLQRLSSSKPERQPTSYVVGHPATRPAPGFADTLSGWPHAERPYFLLRIARLHIFVPCNLKPPRVNGCSGQAT